ncbi:hypothetical protein HED50_21210 [Ochrobactrum oryzae]|nr:hypothetical protein [Brucella oryzae]
MIRKLAVILSAIVLAYSIPAKADRLVCSQSEHLRYMKMVGEVGEMGIDRDPVGEDVAAFERLTAAYETLNPKGPKTSLLWRMFPPVRSIVRHVRKSAARWKKWQRRSKPV